MSSDPPAAPPPSGSLPASLQPAVDAFTAGVERLAGERLRGVAVYGSAIGGWYRPPRSDVNLLVVLHGPSPSDLAAIGKLARAERRARLSPVVLAAADLPGLAASHPATLWDIQARQVLIKGEDALAGLEFRLQDLLHQVRFELRDKRCRLLAMVAERGADQRAIQRLVTETFGSVLHLLRAMLRLWGAPADLTPLQALGEVARVCGLDSRLLAQLYRCAEGEPAPHAEQLLAEYLQLLATAASRLDALVGRPLPVKAKKPEAGARRRSKKAEEPEVEAAATVKPEAEPQAPLEPEPEPAATPEPEVEPQTAPVAEAVTETAPEAAE